jgi:hypothetical protein
MRKQLKDRQQGGKGFQRGSWAKAFRDFYAEEAKAVGMPVDQFLDLVGDRLEERGQRPNNFRRELKSQRRREHPAYFSHWLEE